MITPENFQPHLPYYENGQVPIHINQWEKLCVINVAVPSKETPAATSQPQE